MAEDRWRKWARGRLSLLRPRKRPTSTLGERGKDEGLGLMGPPLPEGSPRQLMVVILAGLAASSADGGPESAGQCLTLPRTELGTSRTG